MDWPLHVGFMCKSSSRIMAQIPTQRSYDGRQLLGFLLVQVQTSLPFTGGWVAAKDRRWEV